MSKPPDQSVRRRAAIGLGWLLLSRIVTRAIGLLSTLVLVRVLAPEDFGLVGLVVTFLQAIEAISALGIQDSLVRHKDYDDDLINTAFTINLIRSLSIGGIVMLSAYPASIYFGEPRVFTLLIALGFLFLFNVENMAIVYYRREMRFDIQFVLLLVPKLISFSVTMVLIVFFQSYWILVIGSACSVVSYNLMTYVLMPFRPRLTLSKLDELFSFSFWNWLSSLGRLVLHRGDPFFIGRQVGSSLLGIYLIAAEVALLPITELVVPAAAAIFPAVSMIQRNGREALSMTGSVMASTTLVVMPLAITLSAMSGSVVNLLLGQKWTAAEPLVAIMAWGCLFYPFNRIGAAIMTARGEVRKDFFAVAVSALARAVAMVLAATTGDLQTIAVASVGCAAIEAFSTLVALRSCGETGFRRSFGSFGRVLVAGAAMAVLLWSTGYGWTSTFVPNWSAYVSHGVVALGAVFVYAATLGALWLMSGRPSGPESEFVDFARNRLRRWI